MMALFLVRPCAILDRFDHAISLRGKTVLRYRDFVPKRTGATFLKAKPEFESFDDAVMAANDWIHEEAIDVFSLETVVLPGVWEADEAGKSASATPLAEAGQFVRVWYRTAM